LDKNRQITDLTDLSDERYKMVFTHGEHFDVAYDHHLIMVLVEHGVVQYIYITALSAHQSDRDQWRGSLGAGGGEGEGAIPQYKKIPGQECLFTPSMF